MSNPERRRQSLLRSYELADAATVGEDSTAPFYYHTLLERSYLNDPTIIDEIRANRSEYDLRYPSVSSFLLHPDFGDVEKLQIIRYLLKRNSYTKLAFDIRRAIHGSYALGKDLNRLFQQMQYPTTLATIYHDSNSDAIDTVISDAYVKMHNLTVSEITGGSSAVDPSHWLFLSSMPEHIINNESFKKAFPNISALRENVKKHRSSLFSFDSLTQGAEHQSMIGKQVMEGIVIERLDDAFATKVPEGATGVITNLFERAFQEPTFVYGVGPISLPFSRDVYVETANQEDKKEIIDPIYDPSQNPHITIRPLRFPLFWAWVSNAKKWSIFNADELRNQAIISLIHNTEISREEAEKRVPRIRPFQVMIVPPSIAIPPEIPKHEHALVVEYNRMNDVLHASTPYNTFSQYTSDAIFKEPRPKHVIKSNGKIFTLDTIARDHAFQPNSFFGSLVRGLMKRNSTLSARAVDSYNRGVAFTTSGGKKKLEEESGISKFINQDGIEIFNSAINGANTPVSNMDKPPGMIEEIDKSSNAFNHLVAFFNNLLNDEVNQLYGAAISALPKGSKAKANTAHKMVTFIMNGGVIDHGGNLYTDQRENLKRIVSSQERFGRIASEHPGYWKETVDKIVDAAAKTFVSATVNPSFPQRKFNANAPVEAPIPGVRLGNVFLDRNVSNQLQNFMKRTNIFYDKPSSSNKLNITLLRRKGGILKQEIKINTDKGEQYSDRDKHQFDSGKLASDIDKHPELQQKADLYLPQILGGNTNYSNFKVAPRLFGNFTSLGDDRRSLEHVVNYYDGSRLIYSPDEVRSHHENNYATLDERALVNTAAALVDAYDYARRYSTEDPRETLDLKDREYLTNIMRDPVGKQGKFLNMILRDNFEDFKTLSSKWFDGWLTDLIDVSVGLATRVYTDKFYDLFAKNQIPPPQDLSEAHTPEMTPFEVSVSKMSDGKIDPKDTEFITDSRAGNSVMILAFPRGEYRPPELKKNPEQPQATNVPEQEEPVSEEGEELPPVQPVVDETVDYEYATDSSQEVSQPLPPTTVVQAYKSITPSNQNSFQFGNPQTDPPPPQEVVQPLPPNVVQADSITSSNQNGFRFGYPQTDPQEVVQPPAPQEVVQPPAPQEVVSNHDSEVYDEEYEENEEEIQGEYSNFDPPANVVQLYSKEGNMVALPDEGHIYIASHYDDFIQDIFAEFGIKDGMPIPPIVVKLAHRLRDFRMESVESSYFQKQIYDLKKLAKISSDGEREATKKLGALNRLYKQQGTTLKAQINENKRLQDIIDRSATKSIEDRREVESLRAERSHLRETVEELKKGKENNKQRIEQLEHDLNLREEILSSLVDSTREELIQKEGNEVFDKYMDLFKEKNEARIKEAIESREGDLDANFLQVVNDRNRIKNDLRDAVSSLIVLNNRMVDDLLETGTEFGKNYGYLDIVDQSEHQEGREREVIDKINRNAEEVDKALTELRDITTESTGLRAYKEQLKPILRTIFESTKFLTPSGAEELFSNDLIRRLIVPPDIMNSENEEAINEWYTNYVKELTDTWTLDSAFVDGEEQTELFTDIDSYREGLRESYGETIRRLEDPTMKKLASILKPGDTTITRISNRVSGKITDLEKENQNLLKEKLALEEALTTEKNRYMALNNRYNIVIANEGIAGLENALRDREEELIKRETEVLKKENAIAKKYERVSKAEENRTKQLEKIKKATEDKEEAIALLEERAKEFNDFEQERTYLRKDAKQARKDAQSARAAETEVKTQLNSVLRENEKFRKMFSVLTGREFSMPDLKFEIEHNPDNLMKEVKDTYKFVQKMRDGRAKREDLEKEALKLQEQIKRSEKKISILTEHEEVNKRVLELLEEFHIMSQEEYNAENMRRTEAGLPLLTSRVMTTKELKDGLFNFLGRMQSNPDDVLSVLDIMSDVEKETALLNQIPYFIMLAKNLTDQTRSLSIYLEGAAEREPERYRDLVTELKKQGLVGVDKLWADIAEQGVNEAQARHSALSMKKIAEYGLTYDPIRAGQEKNVLKALMREIGRTTANGPTINGVHYETYLHEKDRLQEAARYSLETSMQLLVDNVNDTLRDVYHIDNPLDLYSISYDGGMPKLNIPETSLYQRIVDEREGVMDPQILQNRLKSAKTEHSIYKLINEMISRTFVNGIQRRYIPAFRDYEAKHLDLSRRLEQILRDRRIQEGREARQGPAGEQVEQQPERAPFRLDEKVRRYNALVDELDNVLNAWLANREIIDRGDATDQIVAIEKHQEGRVHQIQKEMYALAREFQDNEEMTEVFRILSDLMANKASEQRLLGKMNMELNYYKEAFHKTAQLSSSTIKEETKTFARNISNMAKGVRDAINGEYIRYRNEQAGLLVGLVAGLSGIKQQLEVLEKEVPGERKISDDLKRDARDLIRQIGDVSADLLVQSQQFQPQNQRDYHLIIDELNRLRRQFSGERVVASALDEVIDAFRQEDQELFGNTLRGMRDPRLDQIQNFLGGMYDPRAQNDQMNQARYHSMQQELDNMRDLLSVLISRDNRANGTNKAAYLSRPLRFGGGMMTPMFGRRKGGYVQRTAAPRKQRRNKRGQFTSGFSSYSRKAHIRLRR